MQQWFLLLTFVILSYIQSRTVHTYLRNRDTLPGMDALAMKTSLSSSSQLMFSMSFGDCCQVEGHCVEDVEPQNTAAEALLLVQVGRGEGKGGEGKGREERGREGRDVLGCPKRKQLYNTYGI